MSMERDRKGTLLTRQTSPDLPYVCESLQSPLVGVEEQLSPSRTSGTPSVIGDMFGDKNRVAVTAPPNNAAAEKAAANEPVAFAEAVEKRAGLNRAYLLS